MAHYLYLVLTVLLFPSPDSKPEASVSATVETTLRTASQNIRQYAFDGDEKTSFISKQNPAESDHFILRFEKSVTVKSISVKTGKVEGTDRLEDGILEVSTDGKTYEGVAKFSAGIAQSQNEFKDVIAFRIKPTAQLKHPLQIRECLIESTPTIITFKYPVEFTVDSSDAPELQVWAEKTARLCEQWYPRINEELKSEGYKPPHQIKMTLSSSYNGVAEAGGNQIKGSVKFFKAHPDDVGAMIHETCHVVQNYHSRGNPGWLVEGVADYVRFFVFEPGKIGRVASDPHYNNSYRTTAAFLAFVANKYDKQLVLKLNKLMRQGQFKSNLFKDLTGKNLKELDDEWRATLKK